MKAGSAGSPGTRPMGGTTSAPWPRYSYLNRYTIVETFVVYIDNMSVDYVLCVIYRVISAVWMRRKSGYSRDR